MFLIALKIVLCSAILISIFYLFLEKEKMFSFNRFFLIFALVFSYAIPFIVLKKEIPKPQNLQISFEESVQKISAAESISQNFDWMDVLWIFYGIVSFFFLMKAVLSLMKIAKINGKKIQYKKSSVLISDENISPFSFINTIYINKKYWINNEINPEIFLHEKAHLKQKHSLDLIFLEILKIFSWWNPTLYFYKNAIVNNHEFSADNEVLKNEFEIGKYQNLILSEIISEPKFPLVHSFNFNNTKKRFIMMTFKNSKFETAKKLFSFCVLIACFFLFSEKTYASEKETVPNRIKVFSGKIFEKENIPAVGTPEKKVVDTIGKKNFTEKLFLKTEKKIQKNKETVPMPKNVETPEGDFVQAQFPGSRDDYRLKLASSFDTSVFDGIEGTVKTEAFMYINEKGEVSRIETKGENEKFNQEAKRTIEKFTNDFKFIPATLNGKPVSTVFKLPMTMSFESPAKQ